MTDFKKIIRCAMADIFLEDGIIKIIWHPSSIVTEEDMLEIYKARSELTNDKKYPHFADARGIKAITDAAEKLTSTEEVVKVVSCRAILIKEGLNKMMGDFYLKFNRPPNPTKLFTDEKKAMQWIRSFVEYANEKEKVLSDDIGRDSTRRRKT